MTLSFEIQTASVSKTNPNNTLQKKYKDVYLALRFI